MFRMLSCFNLKAGVSMDKFHGLLAAYTALLQALDLVDSTAPSGSRQANTIMDTDDERGHQYFVTLSFRDRALCDRTVDCIRGHQQPGDGIHRQVYARVVDQVFICREDL
ncbi:MAG TPA: hypothetical protein VMZ32_15540 [Gammaproteobacteria bacterium]|nr:hypothetical protein [Gammaproteobacteria bacterium]